ncbi:MAG: acyl-CoA reductase [Bacteroidia bacterium]
MTQTNQTTQVLDAWGSLLNNQLQKGQLDHATQKAHEANAWFTPENLRFSLQSIIHNFLNSDKLDNWLSTYDIPENHAPKTVALVMAGNLPLVGLHDLLAVMVTGNRAMVKMSSKDQILLPALLDELFEIEPAWRDTISLVKKLENFDAVIATGSDNTARYFHYYFGKYPHIIRKNRNSVAILTGNESEKDLRGLGEDMLRYFGLGCRNVSKIYVPENFSFIPLFEAIEPMATIGDHNKYYNNYMFHKSLMLINKVPHLDNGFLLLKEDEQIASPLSVVHTHHYKSLDEVNADIAAKKKQIQVVVGYEKPGELLPGEAQQPELWDYADKVDPLNFLLNL